MITSNNPTDRQRPLAALAAPASTPPDSGSGEPPNGPPANPWADVGATLVAALAESGATQGALANLLEVTRPSVSQWCAGSTRPTWVNALLIEAILGVSALSWLTAAEVEFVHRVLNKINPPNSPPST